MSQKYESGIEEQLESLLAYLSEQPDVVLVYLFGSHARHQARATSDLDIAVLLDEQERDPLELLERRLDLGARVQDIMRGPVDVVLLNRAPLLLQGEVMREGKLLYEADRAARVEYEVRARTLWFDFQPRLRVHQEALLQRAREGSRGNH
jgi:uncharacterized protein